MRTLREPATRLHLFMPLWLSATSRFSSATPDIAIVALLEPITLSRFRMYKIKEHMPEDIFETLEGILDSNDPDRAIDFLIQRFRTAKKYAEWFDAVTMRARLKLGLPLVQFQSNSEIPGEARAAYEEAVLEAARKTGDLFLAEGNIPNAWRYLRATGDSDRVAEAMNRLDIRENVEAVIEIALQQEVNPLRGLELILQQYGMCQALTAFGLYTGQKDRAQCISLLSRMLHKDLVKRIGEAIEREEGARPDSTNLLELIAGRDWLFGEYSSYIDTSHLISLLQYCPEVSEPTTLKLFHEFCEYGKRLSSTFQLKGQPPFEDTYADVDHYVLALANVEIETHLEHFRQKATEADPERVGTVYWQALVRLLVALGRHQAALEIALQYFPSAHDSELACPSALRLCQLANRLDLLMQLMRRQGNELTYLAAALELIRKT